VLFIIKESLKLISRAKFSFILSLLSTCISVVLIVASVLLIILSGQFESKLKKNISINIFLKDPISEQKIKDVKDLLKEEAFISSLQYIDKEKAAENFIKETGEDFRKILDYNPLPASFRIRLNENYADNDSINKIISSLSQIEGVDEIVYQQRFVSKILTQINNIKQYIFIITGALLLISVYILYSTMQLIINSKYEELDTMKLVGAKIWTIKMPIFLNGIYIGFFAGIIALILFIVLFHYLEPYIGSSTFNINNPLYIVAIICIGPLLSVLVSIVSLRKVSLKI
jgi:cell division transport system permease protein